MSVRHVDYEGVLEIHKEIIRKMGGKFVVINYGNLRYCLGSVLDKGHNVLLIERCIEKAAFYIWCICLAHAFLDCNKRTAFQVAYVFLVANGFELRGSDTEEIVSMMINISTRQITIDSVRNWIRKHIKSVVT